MLEAGGEPLLHPLGHVVGVIGGDEGREHRTHRQQQGDDQSHPALGMIPQLPDEPAYAGEGSPDSRGGGGKKAFHQRLPPTVTRGSRRQ